jgi:hypothetical protein
MLIKRVKPVFAALIAAITVCGTPAYAAGEDGVLVVPSRYTVIQLAFDVAALRDTTLISYQKSDTGKDPVLYVWNSTASAWKSISIGEYSIGAFSTAVPKEMILIGSDGDLPASIIDGASQAEKVTRIETLNAADIVNKLDQSMKFTPSEWKALANKHGFTIKDNNEERRRWGRYGPPGKKKIEKKTTNDDIDIFEDNCPPETDTENPFEELNNELKIPEANAPMHLEIPAEDKPIPEQPATVKSAELDQPVPVIKPKTADEVEFPEDK